MVLLKSGISFQPRITTVIIELTLEKAGIKEIETSLIEKI
jgi:hypothetical protein